MGDTGGKERWTHPIAKEVSRICWAFKRGDSRWEDIIRLADSVEAALTNTKQEKGDE